MSSIISKALYSHANDLRKQLKEQTSAGTDYLNDTQLLGIANDRIDQLMKLVNELVETKKLLKAADNEARQIVTPA